MEFYIPLLCLCIVQVRSESASRGPGIVNQSRASDEQQPRQQPLQSPIRLAVLWIERGQLALVERHLLERDHLRLLDQLVPERQQQEERLSRA